MTMLATLGILAYAKFQAPIVKLFPKGKGRLRFVRWLARGTLLSLLITLTTTLCLLPVLWLTLGSYSLMTPLANLLLVPIAPALLFGAVLALCLPFSPIGIAIAPIAKLVLYLSRFFASFDLMLALRAAYVPYIMIPLIVLSALLLVLDLKQRYFHSLLTLALSVLADISAVFPSMEVISTLIFSLSPGRAGRRNLTLAILKIRIRSASGVAIFSRTASSASCFIASS
jgi:hypothetical protein